MGAKRASRKRQNNNYSNVVQLNTSYQKEKQKLDSFIRIVQFKQNEQGIHRCNGTFVPFKELKQKDDEHEEKHEKEPPQILSTIEIPDSWEDLDEA